VPLRGSRARRLSPRTCSRQPAFRPARRLAVARPPCVVKADGLAAGKGVFVCRTQEELDAGLSAAARLGSDFLVEELLEGEEVSLFAISDGSRTVGLTPAQDFKRIGDHDTGPNTGGMVRIRRCQVSLSRRSRSFSKASTGRCWRSLRGEGHRSPGCCTPG
jgi:phosphoribosylamine-glycine ligase